MKKYLLPIAISAALFCGSNANAQTMPTWYNFQGIVVEHKSEQVQVKFDVKNEAGTVVYSETADVTTTAQGAFTHRLGTGAATVGDWTTGIDWSASDYTLVVSINDKEVCATQFGAVPYATVAENLLGFDLEEYSELAIDVKGLRAGMNELEGLADGLATTQEDVINLTEGNRENKAAIADLEQYVEGIIGEDGMLSSLETGLTQLTNRVEDNTSSIDTNSNLILSVSNNLANTQTTISNLQKDNKQNQADITALHEALYGEEGPIANLNSMDLQLYNNVLTAQEDIENLQNAIYGEDGPIANLNTMDLQLYNNVLTAQEDIENLQNALYGEDGPIANLNTMDLQLYNNVLTAQEDIEALNEGLATTQEDVMNLTEGNKENKAAIAELKVDVQGVGELVGVAGEIANANAEAIEALHEAIYGEEGPIANLNTMDLQLYNNVLSAQEDIEALNEGLAITQEDVMNLTEGNKENKAAIADIKETMVTYTDLQNYNENVDMVYVSKETYYADQAVVEEGLATTQEDVMNLTQGNKENKAAIADIKETMLTYSDLENYNENVDMVYVSKETYYADQAVVEEGLATTQEDVMNLTEGNKENKAAIAELKVDVQGVGELVGVAGEIANANAEAIEALNEGLAITQEDVMNLTEGNKENKAAIAEIKETMVTYSDLQNYNENVDMVYVSKETYYADQAVVEEGLATTQEDVMNLTEGNKENKAAIASLQADLANLGENIDALPGMFENYDEQIETLADGLDNTQTDVMNLTTANTERKAEIAELQSKLANLGENIEMLSGLFELVQELQERIETLEAKVAELESK